MTKARSKIFQDYIATISPILHAHAVELINNNLHTYAEADLAHSLEEHEIEELAENAVLSTISLIEEDELHQLDHIQVVLAIAAQETVFTYLLEKKCFEDLEVTDPEPAHFVDEQLSHTASLKATQHSVSDKLMAQFEKAANFLEPKKRDFLYGIVAGNTRTRSARDAGITTKTHSGQAFRSSVFIELYELAVSQGCDELAEFLKENAKKHGGAFQEKIRKAPLASTVNR